VIANRYRVDGYIGRGGMAALISAVQLDLGRRVAIKLMPPKAAKSGLAVERFLREARAASAIESDHVVKVFDVGKLDQGMPFMVMELLLGSTLARLVDTRGPLPIPEALDYIMQTLVAVAECHRAGIVHRDLKPENIMVLESPGQRGLVKVLDFGISKADWFEAEHTPRLTTTFDVFGTPTHMSPEQVRSSKLVDARSDIWAIGVILYEVFTGRPPFLAESVPALSAAIVSDEPVPPSHLRPDLPAELERIILSCLAKKPADRPQTVQLLAGALAPFVDPATARHVERAMSIGTNESRPLQLSLSGSSGAFRQLRETANAWGTTHQRRRVTNRGIALGVGAGVMLFVLTIGGFFVISRLRARPADTVEPDVASVGTEPAPIPPPATAATVVVIPPTLNPAAPPAPTPAADAGAEAKKPARHEQPRPQSGPLDDRH
jgi:serine/threonine-protein kinase